MPKQPATPKKPAAAKKAAAKPAKSAPPPASHAKGKPSNPFTDNKKAPRLDGRK